MESSTLQPPNDAYRLLQQPSWRALQRHLSLTRGANVLFLVTPDATWATLCRHSLEKEWDRERGTLLHLEPDVPNDPASLLECLESLLTSPKPGVVWIQLPFEVPYEFVPDAQAAWGHAFASLNPHRNRILQGLPAPLIFAGPPWMFQSFRSHAPDWFSVRAGVFDLAQDIARAPRAGEGTGRPKPTSRPPPRESELPHPEFQFNFSHLGKADLEQRLEALPPPARTFLETLSWLDPHQPIPVWLLAAHPPLPDAADPVQAIAMLAREHLLELSVDHQWLLLPQHLVQVVHQHFEDESKRRASLDQALAMIYQADLGPTQNPDNWPRWIPVAPHAIRLAENAGGREDWRSAIGLRNDVAGLYQFLGRYAEALSLYGAALKLAEAHLPHGDEQMSAVLNDFAALLGEIGRHEEAEPLCRRALEIDEKIFGREHPVVAADLIGLAGVLRSTDRLVEAEQLLRRALAIDAKTLGHEHPKISSDLNNLAVLLRSDGRAVEAEQMYRRALAISEKSLGPGHPTVATELNNLAVLVGESGRKAEAEAMYRRALEIDEKALGLEHPVVAERSMNLASVLHDMGRNAEALPLIQRAVGVLSSSAERNGYAPHSLASARSWLRTIQDAGDQNPKPAG